MLQNLVRQGRSRKEAKEVKLLQAIANQAAIAIGHTTLIEKTYEMREALAARKLMERAKG